MSGELTFDENGEPITGLINWGRTGSGMNNTTPTLTPFETYVLTDPPDQADGNWVPLP